MPHFNIPDYQQLSSAEEDSPSSEEMAEDWAVYEDAEEDFAEGDVYKDAEVGGT